ncbi:MAG: oligosaccharide flippase family protein, partial [Lachnospiraceae bacterium]|nr:oligosaccharide flippase family protein [Lachnospiraceae bacterium]
MKGKYKNLSGNIILFSISSFGHKLLAFLLIPLYTNFLSTEQYGTIDLIGTTVNLLVPLFTLNISEAVMRFTIDDKENDGYLTVGARTIIVGSCILACLLTAIYFVPALSVYKAYYGWIFIIYLANSIYVLEQNYLRATDNISIMVTASLINSAVMLVLDVVLIAVFKWGINGYYIAMLLGLGCSSLFMDFKLKLHKHIHLRSSNVKIRKECFAYCIPTIFTALAWWANSGIDRYFVTGICGVDQNGIYSISYKIPTMLGIFQNIFNQAWILSAITEFDRNDSDGFFGKTYEMYN